MSRDSQLLNASNCDKLTQSRFNEELGRAEWRTRINVNTLAKAACQTVGGHLNSVASVTKFAEGGFNRILEVTFNDGHVILASGH